MGVIGAVTKISFSLKSNRQIEINLSKFLIQPVNLLLRLEAILAFFARIFLDI